MGTITASNTEMRARPLTINTIRSKTPTMMREVEPTVTKIEGTRTKEDRYLSHLRDSREVQTITSNSLMMGCKRVR